MSHAAAIRPPRTRALAARAGPIVLLTVLAGALRLASLGGAHTNPFYDAAVRSMSLSLHNFFFAAFDPGAGLAIDKPPVDLWLQVASVKLLGFDTPALILPQALAATAAVPLLWATVRPLFGPKAALAAAAALAVLPVSVETARSDTMDSLMMALNVLAALLAVRALETHRLRPAIIAAALVGLNFDVKLFEALLALPALLVLYALAARVPLRTRAIRLTAAVAIVAVVALSWPAAVSLFPRSSRPYASGSTDGSVWNAIFVYNGLDRVRGTRYTSLSGPPPRLPAATARLPLAALTGSGRTRGPLRLLQLRGSRFGELFGVELVAALAFGGLAFLAAAGTWLDTRAAARRARLSAAEGPAAREQPPRSPPWTLPQAGAVAIAVWLLLCLALFSLTRGAVYPRYLEAMTPAVAGAAGIGAVAVARLARRCAVGLAATLAALILVAAYSIDAARGDHVLEAAVAAAAVLAAAAAFATRLAADRLPSRAATASAALLLLPALIPAAERSVSIARTHASDSGGRQFEPPARVRAVSDYLRRHSAGLRYETAAYAYPQAAQLIVRDARPILVLMSFHDPVVSVDRLAADVRAGRVRYAIVEGHCGRDPIASIGDCPATVRWLRRRSVDVTRAAGIADSGVLLRIDHDG